MVEYFDHTADIGMHITASSLPELFAEAGRGLFALIIENLAEVQFTGVAEFRLGPRPLDYLLFDWLKELLYRFDQGHEVLGEFKLAVSAETGLTATMRSAPLDPNLHQLDHEVKAITYHELVVRPTANGWEARVILDI
jgi:SHS2 domain-containing protein